MQNHALVLYHSRFDRKMMVSARTFGYEEVQLASRNVPLIELREDRHTSGLQQNERRIARLQLFVAPIAAREGLCPWLVEIAL